MQMMHYTLGKHFRLSQSPALHMHRMGNQGILHWISWTLLKSGLQSFLLGEPSDPVLQSFDNP